MNNNIFILLWLFSLFFLQFDNFLSFYQVNGQLKLNGMWERIDNDGYEDNVHLNQEGNRITATFEPTSNCYENPFNRELGISYDAGKLEFSGDLTGNIIQGKKIVCLIDEWTTKLEDFKLTVTDDGKKLDGFVSPDTVEQRPIEYVFVSSPENAPSIEVSTDKPNYNFHENIGISGKVGNMGTEPEVLIQIYDPDEKQVFATLAPINSDGSFMTNFDFSNVDLNGTYKAFAIYPNATGKDSADFGYGLPSKGFSTANMGVASGTIAAFGAGAVFLYKQGYFKRIEQLFNNGSQNHETPDLPVVYVGVECGLENPELPKNEIRKGIGTQDIIKLEQGFSKAVDDILKNRKVIKNVQKDIHFIKWCKEAKENPNKILSKLSDDIINKFLSSTSPYFGNLILSELRVESDVSVTRDRHKSIKKSLQFNLIPIEPYIEFVLYINTQRVSSAKFIFTIETNVEVKNLTVNTKTVYSQVEKGPHVRPEKKYGKKVSIENLLFIIAVEFSRLKIGMVEKNLSPPVIIGRKKVEVKKFGFSDR